MPGADLQVVAVGEEMRGLVGESPGTFWRAAYGPFANFGMESVRVPLERQAPATATAVMPRHGHLLAGLSLIHI